VLLCFADEDEWAWATDVSIGIGGTLTGGPVTGLRTGVSMLQTGSSFPIESNDFSIVNYIDR
jgi:hypothetical protein